MLSRRLPPPQLRRVQPTRSSRLTSTYCASSSSDDGLQISSGSSSPAAASENASSSSDQHSSEQAVSIKAGSSRQYDEATPPPPMQPVSMSLARSSSPSSPDATPPVSKTVQRKPLVLPATTGALNDSKAGNGPLKVGKVTAKAGSKVYQCAGYTDCSMVFTRAEHLARHIRYVVPIVRSPAR